jgi:hypothetical protein
MIGFYLQVDHEELRFMMKKVRNLETSYCRIITSILAIGRDELVDSDELRFYAQNYFAVLCELIDKLDATATGNVIQHTPNQLLHERRFFSYGSDDQFGGPFSTTGRPLAMISVNGYCFLKTEVDKAMKLDFDCKIKSRGSAKVSCKQ